MATPANATKNALNVRLNLPDYHSPEPFSLSQAPSTLSDLTRAVLEQIGGFTPRELDSVCSQRGDNAPLSLYGELCDDHLIELITDEELQVFLTTAESPSRPTTVEVRPRSAAPPAAPAPAPAESVPYPPAGAQGGSQADTIAYSQQVVPQTVAPAGLSSGTTNSGQHNLNGSSIASLAGQNRVDQLNAQPNSVEEPPEVPRPLEVSRPYTSHAPDQRVPAPPGQTRDIQDNAAVELKAAPDSRFTMPKEGRNQIQETPASNLDQSIAQPRAGLAQSKIREERLQAKARQDDRPQVDAYKRPSTAAAVAGWSNTLRSSSSATTLSPSKELDPDGGHNGIHCRVYDRLYYEGEERQRRLAEAQRRHVEQQDESIRNAARQALAGNYPSPIISSSSPLRSRPPLSAPPPQQQPSPQILSRTASAPRIQGSPQSRPQTLSRTASDPRIVGTRRPMERVPTPQRSGTPERNFPSGVSSIAHAESVNSDASSLAQNGSIKQRHGAPAPDDEDESELERLRRLAVSQHQRIEFLEQMHRRALEQIRIARMECEDAQQKWQVEADRALELEQLASEMQAWPSDGRQSDDNLRFWEEWTNRAKLLGSN